MKKFAIILLSILIAGLFVACNQDITVDAQTYANMEVGTFVLNGQNYATLQAAVDAIGSKAAGDNVIYLTKNASGPGAKIANKDVTIDFQGYTYSFTNVNGLQGQDVTDKDFGLSITTGSDVVLKGLQKIDLNDKTTTDLTMVYVEGATTSLTIEDALKMEVADSQYVFWAANGATLTIGGRTTMTGGLAATGTTEKTPMISVNDEAKATVSNMKLEAASVVPNSSQAMTVSTLEASAESKIINSGEGGITVTTDNSGSGTYTVQNTSSSSETTVKVGNETIAQDTAKEKTSDGTWSDKTPSVAMVGAEGYETLALAIASGNGKTVKLVADVDEGVAVDSGKTITLDLNGKTIGKTAAQTIYNSGTLNIENGNETLGYVNNTEGFGTGTTKIYAGMFSIDPREKVVEYYTATKNSEEKWVVVEAEVSITQGESTIYRTLADFRDEWNNGTINAESGVPTILLLKDVDMSGIYWGTEENEVIGIASRPFTGLFSGNNHRIINLSNGGATTSEQYTSITSQTTGNLFGLFGYITGTVSISNLTLENVLANIPNGLAVGALISGPKQGSICNLTVENVTVTGRISAVEKTGGLIGYGANYGTASGSSCTLKNCYNYADVTTIGDRAAGILSCDGGYGALTLINCHNYGNVKASTYAAGLVANLNKAQKMSASITKTPDQTWRDVITGPSISYSNCSNGGNIEVTNEGGIKATLFLDKNTEPSSLGFTHRNPDDNLNTDFVKRVILAYYNYVGSNVDWKSYDKYGILAGLAYDLSLEGEYAAFVGDCHASSIGIAATYQNHIDKEMVMKVKTDFDSAVQVWGSVDFDNHSGSQIDVKTGENLTISNGTLAKLKINNENARVTLVDMVVTGSAVNFSEQADIYLQIADVLTIVSGTYSFNPTPYLASGSTAVENAGVWTVTASN